MVAILLHENILLVLIRHNKSKYFWRETENMIWIQTGSRLWIQPSNFQRPCWSKRTFEAHSIKESKNLLLMIQWLLLHFYFESISQNNEDFMFVSIAKMQLLPIFYFREWNEANFLVLIQKDSLSSPLAVPNAKFIKKPFNTCSIWWPEKNKNVIKIMLEIRMWNNQKFELIDNEPWNVL